ncbi:hypothetical protein [Rhodococcus sp. 1139]|uniref:hypothetical protein n=1 Tax=Rhodococcus sp. 1139 TaxID=1833762 RepID=UPI000A71A2F3|nr:hypothetical protein [Rhodococcus sp. 1139]
MSAGMLAFDYWVRNEDRHAGNVLFDPRLGIWLIDHESALAGRSGEGMDSLSSGAKATLSYHMFKDEIDTSSEGVDPSHLNLWVTRIRALPVAVIDAALDEACDRGLIPRSCQKGLKAFLLARRTHLGTLLAGATSEPEQLELIAGEAEGS